MKNGRGLLAKMDRDVDLDRMVRGRDVLARGLSCSKGWRGVVKAIPAGHRVLGFRHTLIASCNHSTKLPTVAVLGDGAPGGIIRGHPSASPQRRLTPDSSSTVPAGKTEQGRREGMNSIS
jgi:hypothetical protein